MPTLATILPSALPGLRTPVRPSAAGARVVAGAGIPGIAPAPGGRTGTGASSRYPVNLETRS